MARPLVPYRTYVIRCWQEPCIQTDGAIYRFSLEILATGERLGFTCSEGLIDALETALAQISDPGDAETVLENEPN